MATQECTDFPEPQDLKEILELFEKLKDTVLAKKNVGQKLLKDVRKYCKDAEKFYKDSGSHSGFLWNVFTNANGIRKSILQNSGTFEKYNNLDNDHGKHEDCIAEALKKCLPKASAALYYLYFMGSNSLGGIQGGDWHDYACNGNDYGHRSGSKVDLYLWLNDRKGQNTGLVKRGFPSASHSFTRQTGQKVAEKLKSILAHDTPGPLQNVLCGFMFVCKWDDALTGHAICFLDKLCSRVSGDSESLLKGPYKDHSEAFKDVCRGLKNSLQPFIDGSSGLSAVCHQNQNLFDSLWDNDKILDCCEWLKTILEALKKSLEKMSQESSAWNPSSLQNASTAGPFKYGFVFKDVWGDSGYISKLQGCISKLTGEDSGSLEEFKNFLFNPSSGSSAGATAGGVVTGLFGAGGLGAGAAYGLNLFGFKNLVTSLISGLLN